MEPAIDPTNRGAATTSVSLTSIAKKPDEMARNVDNLEEVLNAFQLQLETQQNLLKLLQSNVKVRADSNKDDKPKDSAESILTLSQLKARNAALAKDVKKWLESKRPDALPNMQSLEDFGSHFLDDCEKRSLLWFSGQYSHTGEEIAIRMPGT